mgnify:CR=1 FL=1
MGRVMAKKRTAYLDLIRIIACIMVVGVHVSALCLEDLDVTSINFKVMNGFDCFSILGVPLFVMISGSLLLSEEHSYSIKNLYLKKAGRLVFLYFFWFLFYNTVNFIESGIAWSFENIKQEIILESLLGRGIYHLWFLPMMISLYLITPFIKSFTGDKEKCILFLLLFFVIAIIIPTALKFEFPYKTIVASLYERFPNVMFLGYTGYYILGHVLHEYLPKLKTKSLVILTVIAVLSFAAEVYTCNFYSEKTGELSIILNDTMAVNAFVTCTCIFALWKQIKIKESRRLKEGAALTFGVYLLHPFVLHLFNTAGLDTLFAPAYLAVPAVVALVTVITAGIVFILQKVPVIRRLI